MATDLSNFLNQNSKSSSTQKENSPAEFWLNIGVLVPIDGTDTFVSIGGFALDNLKGMKGDTDYAITQRSLLSGIKEAAASLDKGKHKDIQAGNFVIQLRRVGEQSDKVNTDISSIISNLFK